MTTQTPTKPLKILMLHGYTQSGPLFHAKTRALEKNLQKAFPAGLTLTYPTAPLRLYAADIPNPSALDTTAFENSNIPLSDTEAIDSWGWWRRKGSSEPYTYSGLEAGLASVAEVLSTQGPFDGVVGFSQGGALAGMVAALLEPGRREAFEEAQKHGGIRFPESFEKDTGFVADVVHPPLRFAVSYSGFAASTHVLYKGFYEPKIRTPMLHFLGSLDTVVDEKRSLRLVEACADGGADGKRVIYHPGGHFLPSSQKQFVGALVGFIREVVAESEEKEKAKDNGGAEKDGLDDI